MFHPKWPIRLELVGISSNAVIACDHVVFVTLQVCMLTCHSNSIFHVFPQVDMHDMYPSTHLQHNEYARHPSQRQETCQW